MQTAPSPARPLDVELLFTEHAGRLLTFAHRMLGHRADAEDAVQETFLKALRQAPQFDGRSAPSTWLFAIARNTCLDRLRAGGRPVRTFAGLEGLIDQALDGDPDDVAGEVERQWYVAAVREGCLLATLSCLTPDQRAAFVLRVLCGLDVGEVAAVLERSDNAVRVLTSRARQALKGFLCRNCSLYDPDNRCACRNLAGFSLARGWVTADDRRLPDGRAAEVAARAASAVDDLARLTAVYRCLDEPQPRPELLARLRAGVRTLNRPGPEPART
jgi:RNA polymerase sigma-70 factor (ECF subfamily)